MPRTTRPIRPIKTHTFRGRRYELVLLSEVDGFVEEPGEPLSLVINDTVGPRDVLDTTIHEALHATEPRMSEKRVARIAVALSRFLWRLGYRRETRETPVERDKND